MKLCLGTVQLGMDYGIHRAGQPSQENALDILSYAFEHGITKYDSASAYGKAEYIIGRFITERRIESNSIHVISKIPYDILGIVPEEKLYDTIAEAAYKSMENMGLQFLEGYLLHDPVLLKDNIISALTKVKEQGFIRSIGVSIDTPEEAEKALEYDALSVIQIPYNLFDHRLDKIDFFQKAKSKGVTICARSTLLQGMLTLDSDHLPGHMMFAKKYVDKYEEICADYKVSRMEAAIGVVLAHNDIDYIIFGVDSLQQLAEYMSFSEKVLPDKLIDELNRQFANVEERVVNPNLWKY